MKAVADTFEYMYGVEIRTSPALLETPYRGDCEIHDLQMLTQAAPTQQDPQFRCNYFLGQTLFLDLLKNMGDEEFHRGLRELYRLSLAERAANGEAGIETVRAAFPNHQDIVERHWSGGLNAPENRPNEGIERRSHNLIQWDERPRYDGESVTFRGTLLGQAVLSKETVRYARSGGYQNFTLSRVDQPEYVGTILPMLVDGSTWRLDDPGDTVATEYLIEGRTFTVTFRFPESLENPADYVVIVWGFEDAQRKPVLGRNVDLLGYARIRVDE